MTTSNRSTLLFVVDDETDTADLVAMALECAGYQTRKFYDPNEALAALAILESAPTMLLTDFQMPGMSGLELIERFKQSVPDVTTVSISGTLNQADLAGAPVRPDHFLPKPFTATQLVQLVKSLTPAA